MAEPPGDERSTSEDLVAADDAIIGRAFRWSVLGITGILLLVLVGFGLTRKPERTEGVTAKDPGSIPDLVQARSEMPDVSFSDVTVNAGIDFVHTNGARGEKLLPETMGSGAAFLDYDADGDQDILLVNGQNWPQDAGGSAATLALYRNDGSGSFEDVTSRVGLAVSMYGTGAAVGDYDNDGAIDLFVTALGPNRLFHNEGGSFSEVSGSAGVAGGSQEWSTSAGFFDYDNDGDLDLFVCNYVQWSRETDLELHFTLNGTDRAYGPPTNYAGAHPRLYRNDGGGVFADVSEEAGIRVVNRLNGQPMTKALALSFVDLDHDGYLEILVANDTVQNLLFRNRGDGTFEELGAVSGMGFDSAGRATGAMGLDAAHHRDDDQLAIAVANFANEMSSLYVSQTDPLRFTDEAIGEGVGAPSRLFLSFGLFFFDYDLDGRLDLLQANGHLESEIGQVQASQSYRQPAQLFWNAGPAARSCFAQVPRDRVGSLSRPIVGRGAAYADIDGDGDLDVLLTQSGGPPVLLRNEQRTGHAWVRVELIGTRSNRSAIGAWVELRAAGVVRKRQVMPTRSYLSQVELPVTFGLGQAERVEALRVTWPDGSIQEIGDIRPGIPMRILQSSEIGS